MPNILSLLTWWNFFIAGAGWSLFWLASANNGSEVWGFFLLQQYLCVQSTLRILQGPPWTLSIRLFNWIWCKDNVVLQTTYKQLGPQGPWPTVVGPLLCCVDSPQWDSALAGAISRTSLVQPTCLLYLDEPGKAFASSWLYGFQRGECGHSSLAAGVLSLSSGQSQDFSSIPQHWGWPRVSSSPLCTEPWTVLGTGSFLVKNKPDNKIHQSENL